jgi:hypothetical protein
MDAKRLTLFAGHYGSGKTNIALNWAYRLRDEGRAVTVADLDIVNPYFRTKDAEDDLARRGIGLIVSEYANSNVDLPALPSQIYSLVDDRSTYGVLDIGGDDRGALALGRWVPSIIAEDDYDMLFVVNKARPLTRTVEDTLEVYAEVEAACGLPFTGIVNNTNLGSETTAQTVLASMEYAEAVAQATGLPLKMTCIDKRLVNELVGQVDSLFPLDILELYYMQKEGM